VNLTISPQMRIVALVGVIVIVALGGTMLVLGRSHTPAAAAPAGQRHGSATPAKSATPARTKTPAKTTAPPATPPQVKTTTPPATTHKTTTTPAVTHKATTPQKASITHTTTKHKQAKAKFRGNPVYADLPAPLQWQLAHNKVVVVSFYNPNSDVDGISVAEAHAGAVEAGTGFLLVSVLDNKVAGILTALLPGGGLLPEPGVLIYRAPGDIAMRIDGFVDRDTVAQAATNALVTSSATTTSAAVVTP
jgi:hypothetical protein